MTRPSDESVACAFVLKALCYQEMARLGASVPSALEFIDEVTRDAAEFDAESPADVHIIHEKVTTSPERVQIPAESKRVCSRPSCRAEMRPGLRCSSPHCGLKE